MGAWLPSRSYGGATGSRAKYFLGLLAMLLAGCDGLGDTPFSLQLNSINENGPQQPATITISDAPIFSREALINDRLREQKFINKLLDESEKPEFLKEFKPQVVRDLVNLQALVAQVRAGFDPGKGAAARRSNSLNDLRAQLEETKLRRDIAKAKKQLADAEKDDTKASDIPDSNAAAQAAQGTIALPDIKNLQDRLDKAKKSVGDLLDKLEKRAGEAGAKATSVTATPTERFRDLQAYRGVLRQNLALANLDDLHDFDGNALYRLQFHATVLPGQHKDKLGVARLTYLPPVLEEGDIARLYLDWLNHITQRMNTFLPPPRGRRTNETYGRLELAGLFSIARVKFANSSIDLLLAITPQSKPVTISKINGDYSVLLGSTAAGSSENLHGQLLSSLRQFKFADFKHDVHEELIAIQFTLAKQSAAAYQLGNAPEAFRKLVAEKVGESVTKLETALTTERKGENGAGGVPAYTSENRDSSGTQLKNTDARFLAKGNAYSYATHPIERTQRVSTIARSANSMELALAISANIAQAGAGVQGEVGFIRSAVGNVEALERAPIVVGFADRRARFERNQKAGTDPVYLSEVQAPQSGWIFGPAARINARTNELELRHSTRSYRLAADVSLPGWWPKVRILKETAWIGNFHNTSRVIRLGDEPGQGYHQEYYSTILPRKPADMDSFTNFLSGLTIGRAVQNAEIQHVDPLFLSACSKNVDITISGPNIWRGTEVTLAGLPAEDVRVMPDMQGVVARFDIDKLFASPNKIFHVLGLRRDIALTVTTRNGLDSMILSMEGSRDVKSGSCIGRTPFATTRPKGLVEILDVSPRRIAAGTTRQAFVVRVGRPSGGDDPKFLLHGNAPKKQQGSKFIYTVTFEDKNLTPPGLNAITLTAIGELNISEYPVQVVADDKPKKAAAFEASMLRGTVVASKASDKEVKFQVRFKLAKGKMGSRPRLAVFPDGMPTGTKAPVSVGPPLPVPQQKGNFNAEFHIKSPGFNLANFVDGRLLKFQLVDLREAGASPALTGILSGAPVFYSSLVASQVVIMEPKEAGDFEINPTLAFPAAASAAYSGLTKAKLSATASGLAAIALTVSPDEVKLDKDGKMAVAVNVTPETKAAYDTMRSNTATNKDITVVFKITDKDGRPVIAVNDSFKVKKK